MEIQKEQYFKRNCHNVDCLKLAKTKVSSIPCSSERRWTGGCHGLEKTNVWTVRSLEPFCHCLASDAHSVEADRTLDKEACPSGVLARLVKDTSVVSGCFLLDCFLWQTLRFVFSLFFCHVFHCNPLCLWENSELNFSLGTVAVHYPCRWNRIYWKRLSPLFLESVTRSSQRETEFSLATNQNVRRSSKSLSPTPSKGFARGERALRQYGTQRRSIFPRRLGGATLRNPLQPAVRRKFSGGRGKEVRAGEGRGGGLGLTVSWQFCGRVCDSTHEKKRYIWFLLWFLIFFLTKWGFAVMNKNNET